MRQKQIDAHGTMADLDVSARYWDNGLTGDQKVELWAQRNGELGEPPAR